jgi:tetratricopeptide (TPR) repeat protein
MRSIAPALASLLGAWFAFAANPATALESTRVADGRNAAALSLLETAKQDLNAGRAEQAAALIERALRIDPRNPALWHYLSLARLELGNSDQAAAMAAKSRSLTAHDPPARSIRQLADALWPRRTAGPTNDGVRSSAPRSTFDVPASPARRALPEAGAERGQRDQIAPSGNCRISVTDQRGRRQSWIVRCEEAQRYASRGAAAVATKSGSAAASERRYQRRYGSNELRRQR